MEKQIDSLNPKISVIITTYNRPAIIARAIKSVLGQIYRNVEIIVIDSSTDNTKEILKPYILNNSINYIYQKKNGISAARNFGVKNISRDSKYIAFLDDDDEFLPQFLEKTVEVLEEKEDIAMATSYWELRTRDGKRIRDDQYSVNFWEIPVGSGWVIRKEIFTKENFWYNERLEIMEDSDLGNRVLSNHKWESIPVVARIYYIIPLQNESTLSSNISVRAIELFYKKNYLTYRRLGRKALGYFYFTMGKMFMRAGAGKKGRKDLLKAFLLCPRPIYLLHCFLSLVDLFYPNFFRSICLRTWKQKIFRGRI